LIFVILILLFTLRELLHLYPSLSAHSVYMSLNDTVPRSSLESKGTGRERTDPE
jgi:hypothetical protein